MTNRLAVFLTGIASVFCLTSVSFSQDKGVQTDVASQSVLLQPWTGPYGGVPPWNLVRAEEFVDAFDAAIESAKKDIDSIANQPEPATFENTILAMENSGRELDRLANMFFVHASNLNVGPIPDIEKVVVPKLSEHEDSIYQNLIYQLTSLY